LTLPRRFLNRLLFYVGNGNAASATFSTVIAGLDPAIHP
jgi:hypothetical protein